VDHRARAVKTKNQGWGGLLLRCGCGAKAHVHCLQTPPPDSHDYDQHEWQCAGCRPEPLTPYAAGRVEEILSVRATHTSSLDANGPVEYLVRIQQAGRRDCEWRTSEWMMEGDHCAAQVGAEQRFGFMSRDVKATCGGADDTVWVDRSLRCT
jgi:hypothetical protein